MSSMTNMFLLFNFGEILIRMVLAGLSIYALILVIKALKIYIKKNSNMEG